MQFLWPSGSSNTSVAHYMVTPTLLLLSALLVQLDGRPRRFSPTTWNRVRLGAVLVVFVVALFSFEVASHRSVVHPLGPTRSTRVVRDAPRRMPPT
jgi:hypothetical protein